jgi:hypothetical protein
MLELERNSPIESGVLAEFFARCGWQEPDASAKLEWVLAASEEWVVCRLDGQLIGFGRSCRLDPAKRVVFDVLVDPRFRESGLRLEIVRLLTEHVGTFEDVSIFSQRQADPLGPSALQGSDLRPWHAPVVPPGTYLGRRAAVSGGEE